MSGDTLDIATSGAAQTDFYGVASLDKNKKSAITLLGGVDGTATVILKNVAATGVFGDKVKVKISSTSWTGINGAAEAPNLVREEVYPVDADGNVVVTLDNMVAAAAYNLTVTQADAGAEAGVMTQGAWRNTYEGEEATLAGGAKTAGKNWAYACSGTGQAQGINSAADSVTFKVDVPADGYYRYDMVYGAATGNNTQNTAANNPKNAIQTLSVDGTKAAEIGDFNVLGSQTATTVKTDNAIAGYSAAGYTTGLNTSVKNGGGIRFTTYATDNGMYELKVKYASKKAGTINYFVNNTSLTLDNLVDTQAVAVTGDTWKEAVSTVFLKKGINIIDLDTSDADIAVDTLTVEKLQDQSNTTTIEAEDCKSVGNVTVGTNSNASGEKYVKEILADENAANALLVSYDAAVAGSYEFVVYQSNKELFGSHAYNAQMVDRFITLSVNGGEARNVYFRNTYSDDSFRSQAITLNLKKGVNEIKIYNSNYRLHKNGVGGTNVCTNYTPNLDKFELTRSALVEVKDDDKDDDKDDEKVTYADVTKLKAAIAKANQVKTSLYTTTSVKAMNTAKAAAEQLVKSNPKSSEQSKVDAAAQALEKSMAALKKAVPKKGTKKTIAHLVYQVTKASATKGTVTVVKADKKTRTSVTIPTTVKIDGYTFKVTAISSKAFYKNTKLKKVIIGKNVTTIKGSAFYGAKNLKSITIKSTTLKSVGSKAFKSIHAKAKIKVPAKKLKSYKKLLKGKGQKSTVKITK